MTLSAIKAETPEEPLGRKVRAGVGFSLLNGVSVRLLTLGLGMVVARLIVPNQYGVYAIGFLVLTIITSMNELGVSVAVVRYPTDPTPMLPTAVTMAIVTSTALYALIAVAAPSIAHLLHAPAATTIIRLCALNVVLDGVSSIPNALLMRSFHQGRRTIVDLVAFLPAAAVTIALILAGWGPVGLAVGSLAGNVTAVIMVYALAPGRPRPGWNSRHAIIWARAGLPFAATSAVYLATLNVDYVVVGRMLGTTALGFYVLAFNLSSWPAQLVSLSIRRVAIPGFSQVAHDAAALRRAFARALHLVAGLAVLVSILLALLAEPLVHVFYGSQWLPAVTALRFLAILGSLRVALDLGYDVLVATDRGRLLLVVQTAWLVALVGLLPLGAHLGGIQGVGIAHVVVALGIVVPLYAIALQRAGLSLPSAAAALSWPVGAGVLTAGLLALLGRLSLGPWERLGVLGPGAGLFYVAMLCFQDQNRALVARGIARITA